MECVRLDLKNHKTYISTEKIPEVQSDEDVIVKIAYSGVCATDLHLTQVTSTFPVKIPYPAQSNPHSLTGIIRRHRGSHPWSRISRNCLLRFTQTPTTQMRGQSCYQSQLVSPYRKCSLPISPKYTFIQQSN